MSDAVKWALLAAGFAAIMALILALPVGQYMDFSKLSAAVDTVVSLGSTGFSFGRGLVNNFLSPWARTVFSGLMVWLLAKWALLVAIKVVAWALHFVYK